jgi:hypothetical protein
MNCRKKLYSIAALVGICLVAICADLSANAYAATQKRSDMILLALEADSEKLEFPPVIFLHARHTLAMRDQADSCGLCHKTAGNGETPYDFAYKDADSRGSDSLRDIYHDSCIGCHEKTGTDGRKTGPLAAACRDCHAGTASAISGRREARFGMKLHEAHVVSSLIPAGADGRNCDSCHHVEEQACHTCHLPAGMAVPEDAMEDLLPLKEASHQSCVNCHLAVRITGKKMAEAVPTDCLSCHSPEAQRSSAMRPGVNRHD